MGGPEVKGFEIPGISGPELASFAHPPEDGDVGNESNPPGGPPTVAPGAPVIETGLPERPVPPGRPSRLSIGIDLGTSNSCAAVVHEGRPRIIPSRDGYNTIPSMVALNQRQRVVVGRNAKGQLLVNPMRTVHGAKRLVGRAFDSAVVQSMLPHFPYEVVATEDGLCAARLGPLTLSMEQVQALVLREVKGVAENFLGEEVNRAVITVPAYYSERQREAVRRAGALAGLHVERILNEPTAASLAFAWGRDVKARVLVYDLGGGTFDASVLELADRVFQVVSTGGDTFLGGVDFDARIVAHLVAAFEKAHGRFDADPVALSRLADAAERAKCALSEVDRFDLHLPYLANVGGAPAALDVTLTRADLERLVAPLVERTFRTCARVLDDRGLGPADVDEVILVGGQSRMPLVQERIRSFFGKAPSKAVHPDEAVAIGAALLAHSLNSAEGVVLIDVVPISIGVGLPGGGGRVKRVIERNSPLPVRKEYQLATTKDDQQTFDLWIFEGEGQTVAECQYLGTIQLTGLPRGPRGSVRIAVAFELGEECLLSVRAREMGSGREVSVVFTTKGTPDEVRKRIEKEATYAAAGITPGAAPVPPGYAAPGAPPPVDDPGPAAGGGLRKLWDRLKGR
jgi:molecular chaperone DnaK